MSYWDTVFDTDPATNSFILIDEANKPSGSISPCIFFANASLIGTLGGWLVTASTNVGAAGSVISNIAITPLRSNPMNANDLPPNDMMLNDSGSIPLSSELFRMYIKKGDQLVELDNEFDYRKYKIDL